jgi:hypothetical protein
LVEGSHEPLERLGTEVDPFRPIEHGFGSFRGSREREPGERLAF